ncbi:MAG: chromosomal replication initiator protein DnaA [Fretibacterium sp.]|nr:chromosomal replication initiator protein DnaA [Fretibacterium sp.]
MQQKAEELQRLWKDILAGAEPPEKRIALWLETCDPIGIEGNELVVDTTNPFIQEQLRDNFLKQLNESAAKSGVVQSVRLEVSMLPGDDNKRQDWEARAREASRSTSKPESKPNPYANYTFESFVVGKSNRMAHAASLAVAEMPGKAYNPLFIWGGVGLGKTHLMHAICNYALGRSNNLRVLYLSAEQFLNEFVKAIASSRTAQFKERYRNLDILLIDDIQFLGNKEQSQEEFYHTFNTLRDDGRQVVICSDRQPSELKNIEERLTSRFNWGLVADIQPPDLETRIAILQKKAALRHYALPDEVIHFLAQHIPSNIRDLEGALTRVIMSSELMHEDITIERVSVWLKDTLRMDMKGPVTIEDIKSTVAESFGISLEDLTSSKRTAELVLPRQIAMFLCREMTETSLQQIAHAFRKKDHTTVIHAQQKVGELIKADADIRRTVDNLKNKL